MSIFQFSNSYWFRYSMEEDPDRYSPEMRRVSWAILKQYRRQAEIYHHDLALQRAHDAWFESLEEKDENRFFIMSKSYSDLAQRLIDSFFYPFEVRARTLAILSILSRAWIETHIRKKNQTGRITKPCRNDHCHCLLSDKLLIF